MSFFSLYSKMEKLIELRKTKNENERLKNKVHFLELEKDQLTEKCDRKSFVLTDILIKNRSLIEENKFLTTQIAKLENEKNALIHMLLIKYNGNGKETLNEEDDQDQPAKTTDDELEEF